jgi:hypothetical protein
MGIAIIQFEMGKELFVLKDAIVASDAEIITLDSEKIKQERYAEWLLAITPSPPMSENQDG